MCSHPSHNLFKLVRSFIPMEMKIYTLNIKKQGYKKKKITRRKT